MIIWADGEVTQLRASWPGAVELTVARRDQADTEVRALVYTDLMAAPGQLPRTWVTSPSAQMITVQTLGDDPRVVRQALRIEMGEQFRHVVDGR